VNKSIIVILSFMVFMIINICFGQSKVVHQQQFADTAKFYVTDNLGIQKTSFSFRDTIIFKYRITNRGGKDIGWAMGHGGPWVRFLIQQDTILLADSYQGMFFIQNAPSGIIKIGETKQDQWTLSLSTSQLPSGIYTAIACPQILFIGIGRLPNDSLHFKIN
jgi:hypothetical protein